MALRFGLMTVQTPPYATLAERWWRAEALASLRGQMEHLDAACAAIGRDPQKIRRSLNGWKVDPPPFSSLDAFAEYVGRDREIGIEEFILYWPTDRATRVERERVLERVSLDLLPTPRACLRRS